MVALCSIKHITKFVRKENHCKYLITKFVRRENYCKYLQKVKIYPVIRGPIFQHAIL